MNEKEKAKKPKSRKAETAHRRQPNPAFMKPVQPDELLAAVVGAKPQPRVKITQKLWEYIKANDLQDTVNKRVINCDAKLTALFGVQHISMFAMQGEISKHVTRKRESQGA